MDDNEETTMRNAQIIPHKKGKRYTTNHIKISRLMDEGKSPELIAKIMDMTEKRVRMMQGQIMSFSKSRYLDKDWTEYHDIQMDDIDILMSEARDLIELSKIGVMDPKTGEHTSSVKDRALAIDTMRKILALNDTHLAATGIYSSKHEIKITEEQMIETPGMQLLYKAMGNFLASKGIGMEEFTIYVKNMVNEERIANAKKVL